jgi:Tfp pilus assembly protein PilO
LGGSPSWNIASIDQWELKLLVVVAIVVVIIIVVVVHPKVIFGNQQQLGSFHAFDLPNVIALIR